MDVLVQRVHTINFSLGYLAEYVYVICKLLVSAVITLTNQRPRELTIQDFFPAMRSECCIRVGKLRRSCMGACG